MWKRFLSSIPPTRQLVYLLIVALIPSFCVALHFFSQHTKYTKLSARLEDSTFLFFEKEKKEAVNKAVKKRFSTASDPFVERQLSHFTPLKKEIEKIEQSLKKNSFMGNPFLEERLAFLQGRENRLSFQAELLPSSEGIQDTLLTLKKPVEVDMEDMAQILKIIENSEALFFVVDMQLEKKSHSYFLYLKLLKREIL